MSAADRSSPNPLARRSPRLLRWFGRYVRRYARKNFSAVRLAGALPVVAPAEPLVVVLNHPSWWDPLIGLLLSELLPERAHFAPIESAALARYRFFERLGFFGIDPGSAAGGLAFLRAATAILAQPNTAVWVTAQGHFTDVRERPPRLRPGVGHLVRRLHGGTIVPLALEYPFWNERYPEALACFGAPIPIGRGGARSVDDWLAAIETGLAAAQDRLAADARSREAARFTTLIGGAAGVGGVYDLWRRLRALWRGERFVARHDQSESSAALRGTP